MVRKAEIFILRNEKRESLGIFEMAAGRDMDSQTYTKYGTYEKQAEMFRRRAAQEYGAEAVIEWKDM